MFADADADSCALASFLSVRSLFIDIFRRNPHRPPDRDEEAVMPADPGSDSSPAVNMRRPWLAPMVRDAYGAVAGGDVAVGGGEGRPDGPAPSDLRLRTEPAERILRRLLPAKDGCGSGSSSSGVYRADSPTSGAVCGCASSAIESSERVGNAA
jgi:hypothetical protein